MECEVGIRKERKNQRKVGRLEGQKSDDRRWEGKKIRRSEIRGQREFEVGIRKERTELKLKSALRR
jgi:hypothetical protein